MHETLLGLIRCPFCGTQLSLVNNQALSRHGADIESGLLGCECCAFPIVSGIPLLTANEQTKEAINALETGHTETALLALLGVSGDSVRTKALLELLADRNSPTFREAIGILSNDAESTYFIHRFSDPTYVAAESILWSLAGAPRKTPFRALDLCGGIGQLTRVLTRTVDNSPPISTVLCDLEFWKLWLAYRFIVPQCSPICCDANSPLPFTSDAFSMVLLSDAFPYIWHKRLLADEMLRVSEPEGVIVMPHLHNGLGENFSAGDTLTPRAYQQLFAHYQARLFSDADLLSNLVDHEIVDLSQDITPDALGSEPSMTLIASRMKNVFRPYQIPKILLGDETLQVNPLYRVESSSNGSVLTLTFPSSDYEKEFGECRRYLPTTVRVSVDLRDGISPEMFGVDYPDLRRRRVIIDVPKEW